MAPRRPSPGGKAPLGLGITLELRCYSNRISVGFFFPQQWQHRKPESWAPRSPREGAWLSSSFTSCGDSEGLPTLNPLPGLCSLPDYLALFKISILHNPSHLGWGLSLESYRSSLQPPTPKSTQCSKLCHSSQEWGTQPSHKALPHPPLLSQPP